MSTDIVIEGLADSRSNGSFGSGFNGESRNWLLSDDFLLSSSRPMALVYPKQEAAGSLAAFKWADTSTPYICRPSWRGGHPPYKVTLFNAPVGATIGGVIYSGVEVSNEYTRTLDIVTGRYVHSLPDNFCEISHQFLIGDIGQTFNWSVMVEDQRGRKLFIQWKNGVSNDNVKYFDSTNGNNANAGTFAAPYQTAAFGYALSNSQNYIFKFKDGTYNIDADYAIDATKSRSWIGVGSNVNFNFDSGLFSSGMDDMTFRSLKCTGARLTATNAFNFKFNLVDRCTFYKCVLNNSFAGTVRDDNPAAIAFWGNASLEHDDISIINCTQPATAKAQMLVTFDVNSLIVENCHATGVAYSAGNGSKFLHIKDETRNVSVRHCTVSGTSADGLFDFSNQGPEQCDNQEILFCAADNLGETANSGVFVWNDASTGNPCKGTNQFMQRCTIRAGTQVPMWFRNLGSGGEPVNIESVMYSTTNSTIIEGGSSAGVYIGNPSVLVPAIKINSDFTMTDDIKNENLGITGHIIASPLMS